nr:hypothetical protein [Tanacetum cinerariifolium]
SYLQDAQPESMTHSVSYLQDAQPESMTHSVSYLQDAQPESTKKTLAFSKFNAKADDGYFLGYSFNSKAFRVFNTRRQQIEETYHVTFDVDRWLIDQHIEHVNTIGDPSKGMLTRSMAAKLTATSSSECLFADFLSEIESKKVFKALKYPGCHARRTEPVLSNKVWTLVSLPYGKNHRFQIVLCARYQSNQNESHIIVMKRILEYSNRCAKKQQLVAMSSVEAEYVAAARCCASILWMKSQLNDYYINYKMVSTFCNNNSVIAIPNNPVIHSRTKHIDIRYHFIMDHILKRDIELHFILTEYQLADIFTKPLDEPTFTRLKAELGMLNID